MVTAKILKFSAGAFSIELHPSAFAPESAAPQDVKPENFQDMPKDEDLQFWSVEGPEEKKDPAPELKKKGRRRG
jgi:hypothetical protein